jgi:hypothetical protein
LGEGGEAHEEGKQACKDNHVLMMKSDRFQCPALTAQDDRPWEEFLKN